MSSDRNENSERIIIEHINTPVSRLRTPDSLPHPSLKIHYFLPANQNFFINRRGEM